MKQLLLILLIASFLITGCGIDQTNILKEGDQELNTMPVTIPDDFDFIVRFGVGSKNEINTLHNIFTKDLVKDGTVTIDMKFTNEEMSLIYEKMRELNIVALKHLVAEDTNCIRTPYGEDTWEIYLNGEIKKISWSSKYCEIPNDIKKLIHLRDFVIEIVKNKNEYKMIPEANGAYQ